MTEKITPEALRAMAGVDQFPKPVRKEDLLGAINRHYPADLRNRGVAGSVLVEAVVQPSGEVGEIRVVPRPAGPLHRAVLTRHDESGGTTETTLEETGGDARFGEAARAAVREVRFTPAVRDGQPVPFTLRMTIQFDPHH